MRDIDTVSTLYDYGRFCTMMLNDGQLDGARVLGRIFLEISGAKHQQG